MTTETDTMPIQFVEQEEREALSLMTLDMPLGAVQRQAQAQPLAEASPMGMMLSALGRGATVDQIERVLAVQERWEANEAKKAYVDAMAEFKKNPPRIQKRRQVDFENKSGGRTRYRHADHFDVTLPIIEALAKVGISHKWNVSQAGGQVEIECILTHKKGHSESTRMAGPPDQSGGKNAIQAIVSTKTYLERHSLLAATGLSTEDIEDDDGASAAPGEFVSEEVQSWIDYALARRQNPEEFKAAVKEARKAISDARDAAGMRAFNARVS
ncbi:ERF family protein [Curvibacter lanceolatus]|uniref:ERF family protein n=1 Tax=Curvibacter lanceolatus TaxID=86182 RepID=UPI00036B202B|nr:ERF family protein [Curvibacter lanceolatus]